MSWQLADKTLNSRFLIGSALYPSPALMRDAIVASGAEVVTVSLRRQNPGGQTDNLFWELLRSLPVALLPNTAGCHSVAEAVTTAQMARELFGTHWIKLEVIGNADTLQPDPFGLLEASRELIGQGFEVFPYCTDDLVLCERLHEAGCRILMPWAAPIGSARGLINPYALRTLRARLPEATLIIDAGLGKPSDACRALELGYDAVLLNTAVAEALDPVSMARAFAGAIEAGASAFHAGLIPERDLAKASSPTVGQPFWQQAPAP